MKIFALCFFLVVIAVEQLAAEPAGGSFFCIEAVAGGVQYNETIKEWSGLGFRAKSKFVLTLQFIKSWTDEHYDLKYDDYKIWITKEGESSARPCVNSGTDAISVYSNGGVADCTIGLLRFKFSPSKNRFLIAYLEGYLDGDKDGDTPYVSAGTCTKIK